MPSDFHTGKSPPSFDTWSFPSGDAGCPANGRTYTSSRPVSLDTYVIHFAWADRRPAASRNGVSRNLNGLPSWSSGVNQISFSLLDTSQRPSADQSHGGAGTAPGT